MSDDRKKPLWPWIAALLVGLPVLYAASFGPVCWITSRSDRGKNLPPVVYSPLLKLMCWKQVHDTFRPPAGDFWSNGSNSTGLNGHPFCRYAEVGAREGAYWVYTVNYEKHRGEPAHITSEEWEWR
ncbi:MAG: hypothetical protein ACM3U2_06795 [Deltaproteobacteria bacterium]